jgi:hypothetical protein
MQAKHLPESPMYYLFLDDDRKPEDVTWVRLPLYNWTVVRSYDEFVKTIEKLGLPGFISFDHDLADEHYKHGHVSAFTTFDYDQVKEKTGFHAAKCLVDYCMDQKLKLPSFEVHTKNPCGEENIRSYLNNFKNFQDKVLRVKR